MKEEITIKERIMYALGGLIFVGGSFLLGRKLFLKAISNSEEKKSFESGSSATYAKQIKMSFENDGYPGTDVKLLRSTLQAIPTKTEFSKVVQSYKKLYNRSMMFDMSDELQSTEYSEMLNIIDGKPVSANDTVDNSLKYLAWAKRLKAAFDKTYGIFPGTDEQAIKAVFNEIPTQSVFAEVANAYKKIYGNDLISDLQSELEFWEYGDYMNIINSKSKF